MSTAAAVVLFAAIMAYAVFAGADFGAGFWDLVAGGTRRGARPREVIDHSIGPVWEANHVWLIFCFVVLWTCFPEAYASITETLWIPLALAALGIVLRGSGFAFRKALFATRDRRNFGAAVVTGVVAAAGVVILATDTDHLFEGLTTRALPLVISSVVAGTTSLVLLVRGTLRGARLGAIAAVASIVLAWGVAQWDYMLPDTLTIEEAAAPSGTIGAVLVATGFAVVFVVPAFVLLYWLDQRGLLPEEGVEET